MSQPSLDSLALWREEETRLHWPVEVLTGFLSAAGP